MASTMSLALRGALFSHLVGGR